MAFVLKKNKFYFALFALCLMIPYYGSYELTFLIWSFSVLITIQKKYSQTFIKYLSCFILILLISVFRTKFKIENIYSIIRDFTYLLKPILGIILGYQICKYNYKTAFLSLIKISYFVSLIHVFFIVFSVLFRNAHTVGDIRFYCGYFSDFEVYGLIILLFHKKFDIEIHKKKFYLMVAIITFSSLMYLSRNNFIQFIILFCGLKGYFILNKRAILAITSLTLLTVISYLIILAINPKRNGVGFEAFLYKVKIAPTEAFKSKIKTHDNIDFNDNYRSVEIINTIRQMQYKGSQTMLLGEGLGSKVDLKQKVWLGDLEMRYIYVLHNAFMTTYLKSGILGILLLLYSIYLIYNQPKSKIPINKNINFLLVGTAIFLLISNWVLMGYYFTEDSKSILVGFLIAYKEITDKNELLKNGFS
jgi:hypothetical protein